VLIQLAAHWKTWKLPSVRLLGINTLLALPLFLDVFSNSHGFRAPSNDARYLTGLLFGGAFSVYLFPAFILLALSRDYGQRRTGALKYLAPFPAIAAAGFFLKEWNSVIAYGVLEFLGIFGFLSLLGILCLGMFKAAKNIVLKGGLAKSVFFIAIIFTISGCATPTLSLKSDSCDVARFTPSQNVYGLCKKEVCQDGKVVWVEDLTQTAIVDDWAEERFCLRHPINCYKANALKQKTEQWQTGMDGKYWAKERNGLGDAARHAYLVCVLAERFGTDFARGLSTAHEEDSEYLIFFRKAAPGNPCCEKVMDLHNNEIGILLAGKPGSCEENVLTSLHLLLHSLCPYDKRSGEYDLGQ